MSNLDILQQKFCRHYGVARMAAFHGGGCPDCNAEDKMIERINALPSDECMRIMHGKRLKRIPWSMIAGHERQAHYNHGQTLIGLNGRGGLSPAEALAIINDLRWREAITDNLAAEVELISLLASSAAWSDGA